MSLHRTMGNAQRCRHTPFARYLQMKPVALPYRDTQNSLLAISKNLRYKNSLKTKFNQVLNEMLQRPKTSLSNSNLKKRFNLKFLLRRNK